MPKKKTVDDIMNEGAEAIKQETIKKKASIKKLPVEISSLEKPNQSKKLPVEISSLEKPNQSKKSPKIVIKNSLIPAFLKGRATDKKTPAKLKQEKEVKKIVEDTKIINPLKETVSSEEFDNREIDYTIEETTMYDVNWFYCRVLFIKFCNLLVLPYVLYANWFNKKFNPPKPVYEADNTNINLQAQLNRKSLEKAVPKSTNQDWIIFESDK